MVCFFFQSVYFREMKLRNGIFQPKILKAYFLQRSTEKNRSTWERTEITLSMSVLDRIIPLSKELNLSHEIVIHIPQTSGKLLCNT